MLEDIYMVQFEIKDKIMKMIRYEAQVSTINYSKDENTYFYRGYSKDKFDEFVNELKKCNIVSWKHEYIKRSSTEKSFEWTLRLSLKNDNIEYHGLDAYPEEWDKFMNVTNKYLVAYNI